MTYNDWKDVISVAADIVVILGIAPFVWACISYIKDANSRCIQQAVNLEELRTKGKHLVENNRDEIVNCDIIIRDIVGPNIRFQKYGCVNTYDDGIVLKWITDQNVTFDKSLCIFRYDKNGEYTTAHFLPFYNIVSFASCDDFYNKTILKCRFLNNGPFITKICNSFPDPFYDKSKKITYYSPITVPEPLHAATNATWFQSQRLYYKILMWLLPSCDELDVRVHTLPAKRLSYVFVGRLWYGYYLLRAHIIHTLIAYHKQHHT